MTAEGLSGTCLAVCMLKRVADELGDAGVLVGLWEHLRLALKGQAAAAKDGDMPCTAGPAWSGASRQQGS